jgi:hypothetical protein
MMVHLGDGGSRNRLLALIPEYQRILEVQSRILKGGILKKVPGRTVVLPSMGKGS